MEGSERKRAEMTKYNKVKKGGRGRGGGGGGGGQFKLSAELSFLKQILLHM